MQISFFNTKGGCGKTTSVLALLGAIAEQNASSENLTRVLAIDADDQGSLHSFFGVRAAKGVSEAYGIECIQCNPYEDDITKVLEAGEGYDLVLVDLPGRLDRFNIQCVANSDRVLVPTMIAFIETREAMSNIKQIKDLLQTQSIEVPTAMLINRTQANLGFTPSAIKDLFVAVRERHFPILRCFMSNQSAASLLSQYGLYPFELVNLEKGNSAKRLMADSQNLWKNIQAWDLLPEMTGTDPFEGVDRGGNN